MPRRMAPREIDMGTWKEFPMEASDLIGSDPRANLKPGNFSSQIDKIFSQENGEKKSRQIKLLRERLQASNPEKATFRIHYHDEVVEHVAR